MVIKSFFTDNGVPKTLLVPLITIRRVSDSAVVVNALAMTEIAGGWYKYTFANDLGEDYVVTVDGTSTLKNVDRYQSGEIAKDEMEDDDGRIV